MGIFQFKKREGIKEEKKTEGKEERRVRNEKKEKPVRNNRKSEIKLADKDKAEKTVSLKESKDNENNLLQEGQSETACKVLIEPWVTERSHDLMALNKYVFKVAGGSNKNQVKRAIEELYKVKVIKVNIVNIPPKRRNFARKEGWKSGYKKAITTLKEGDRIELFEGA